MEIAYAPYTLSAKGSLNARTRAELRYGALIRVQSKGCLGYSDCHPWPELGDRPLNEQIKLLSEQKTTPITARALHYATLDLQSRLMNALLLSNLDPVLSHFLISDLLQLSTIDLAQIRALGFDCIKLKVGRNLEAELAAIEQTLSFYPFKLRLDFNGTLLPEQFENFLKKGKAIIPFIDCIEDPFPFEPKMWSYFQSSYPIRLAADQDVPLAYGLIDSAAILVCKPAVRDWREMPGDGQKILITSYLGHPVGQVIASYEASLLKNRPGNLHGAGLVSHTVYHENAFSALFSISDAQLCFPYGHGWGFESLLERQEWLPLRLNGAAIARMCC